MWICCMWNLFNKCSRLVFVKMWQEKYKKRNISVCATVWIDIFYMFPAVEKEQKRQLILTSKVFFYDGHESCLLKIMEFTAKSSLSEIIILIAFFVSWHRHWNFATQEMRWSDKKIINENRHIGNILSFERNTDTKSSSLSLSTYGDVKMHSSQIA